MRRIGFFTGSTTSFNVECTLSNIGWMLSDYFDLDLITTEPEYYKQELEEYFRFVQPEKSGTTNLTELRSYVRYFDPDALLNIIKPPNHGLTSALACVGSSTRYVYRYSGDRFKDYQVVNGWRKPAYYCLNNLVGRVPIAICDRAISLGPTGKKRLRRRGIKDSEMSVLPPPVDPKRFTDDGFNFDLPDDRSVALFVGRRTRLKGFDTLQKAIPRIIDNGDDLHFVIIGGGDQTLQIPDKYRNHVTVQGKVSPEDIPRYFNEADLLVHPSLTEGLPRVIPEALVSDTKVVARDVGEIDLATKNTFTSLDQFVKMVSEYESLELDDGEPFIRENLKPKYLTFFKNICQD